MMPIDGNDNDYNDDDVNDYDGSIMTMMSMVRMQLWLNDPGNMDKLLAIKNGQQQVKLNFMMIVIL